MADTRSGTITVLFTDQVASTEAWQQLGEDAANALRRDHTALLEALIARHNGRTVKNTGDGLMAVFASAVDALDASVAMQQAVHRRNDAAGPEKRIGLRVGIETGEPSREGDDYFGTPVVVARRLCDSCEGGQIVTSDLIPRLVGSRGGHAFDDGGMRALKGFTDTVHAQLLRWEPAPEPVVVATDVGRAERVPLPSWLVANDRTRFVGRERELDALSDAWERARAGTQQVVLLEGEPGIGKTRLAGELALQATADDALVLFGACDEGSAHPYQPFAQALAPHVAERSSDHDALRKLAAPVEASESERFLVAEAVTALLTEMSRESPVLLILDDLHWACAPAVALLKHLARSATAMRLLVLGTYRGALVPRSHPLTPVITQLKRERAVEHIALSGMTERQVADFIEAWSGQHASPLLATTMQGRTEGNPLFLEEVLRHLADTGALYEHDQLTEVVSAEALTLPPAIRAVVELQLDGLSDGCRRLLTRAAVMGSEFDLDSVRRMLDDVPVADALDEAMAAGIVAEAPGGSGRYRFAHSLIRDAVVSGLTMDRRLELHRKSLHFAEREGVQLAYEMLGHAGPVLVAVGISNCPSVRARADVVALRWGRTATYCRVLLYDRRGVGSSDVTEHGYSAKASIEDLRAVLDAAGVQQAVLWGAPDGGPLAIAFARAYPERVAGLLLLGTSPFLYGNEEFKDGINPHVMEQFLRLDPVDQARAASEITGSRLARPADVLGIAEVMRRVPRNAWSKIILSIGLLDAREGLGEISVPTLIIHDPDNTYIPSRAARYMHERIPGSELYLTDEYASPLFGDTLHARISDFVNGVVATGSRS